MGAAASVSIPVWAWVVFVGLVVGLLFLDLFVLHRKARVVPFGEALWLSAFWIGVSLAFGVFVWVVLGPDAAGRYLTAYLVEKALSVDNVFVFAVIFSGLAVPERYRYHVLFWGVIGALVFRLLFILAGSALLAAFSWLFYVFGAFLIFTGIRTLLGGGDDEGSDPRNNRGLRLLRRVVPVREDYRGDNFFVREDGKRYATPLLAALEGIEAGGGAVWALRTSAGERIRVDAVVNAVGSCAGEVVALVGRALPLKPSEGLLARLALRRESGVGRTVHSPRVNLRP